MMLLAMGKRRLDAKAHKNASVFCPKSEGEHEARSSTSIFFLLLLSSSRQLAEEVEIHLRNPCSN